MAWKCNVKVEPKVEADAKPNKKIKKEKRYNDNLILDVFVDL